MLTLLVGCGRGEVTDVPVPDVLGSIEVSMLEAPVPVLAEGETQVVYEIHVYNPPGNASVRLSGLTVSDGSGPVASYSATELQQMLSAPGLDVSSGDGRLIYLWFSFPANQVPNTLTHTVAFADTDKTRSVAIDIVGREVTTVKPPLNGAGWYVGNLGNDAGHRRAVYTRAPPEGLMLAQRFAVDWLKLDENADPYVGDPFENQNWYSYGEPVLAVADGQIMATKDGIPDNVRGSLAVEITLETLGGNSVTLKLEDGTGVYYAHLIPGSIRVSQGDLVQVGDTLGFLGNSGNSDAPHLHIHFADVFDWSTAVADADGLPFVFDSFEILGNRPVVGMRTREMPLTEAIVRFN